MRHFDADSAMLMLASMVQRNPRYRAEHMHPNSKTETAEERAARMAEFDLAEDMKREAKALQDIENPQVFYRAINEFVNALPKSERKRFKGLRYAHAERRAYSRDGLVTLEWRTRKHPLCVPSLDNPQGRWGQVFMIQVEPQPPSGNQE